MTEITDHELRRRLSAGEDELTELKANNPNSGDLKRTVVAFANSVAAGQTGTCFIGVHDDGSPIGVDDLDSRQKKVQQIGERDCYPPVVTSCRILEVAGKQILVVLVPHSTKQPHFSGPAYVRQGSKSVVASEQQYENLIASRHDVCRKILSWGQQVVSLEVIGKKLGDDRPLEAIYQASHEVQIQGCDAHAVRLVDIASSRHYSEPLENVLPMYDENKHRPKLRVRLPRR